MHLEESRILCERMEGREVSGGLLESGGGCGGGGGGGGKWRRWWRGVLEVIQVKGRVKIGGSFLVECFVKSIAKCIALK